MVLLLSCCDPGALKTWRLKGKKRRLKNSTSEIFLLSSRSWEEEEERSTSFCLLILPKPWSGAEQQQQQEPDGEEHASRPLWLPREAAQASREMLMYVACLMEGVWSLCCAPSLVELFNASSCKDASDCLPHPSLILHLPLLSFSAAIDFLAASAQTGPIWHFRQTENITAFEMFITPLNLSWARSYSTFPLAPAQAPCWKPSGYFSSLGRSVWLPLLQFHHSVLEIN